MISLSSVSPTRRALTTILPALAIAAYAALAPVKASAQSADQGFGDRIVATPSPLGDMILGPADAKVTIVEYASQSCPHCAAFAGDTFPKLRKDYIDTGKVRFIFREWPHNEYGLAGSVIARCAAAGDTQKYFGLVEKLFDRQIDWTGQDVQKSLQSLGRHAELNEDEFRACFERKELQDGVMGGARAAHETLGVQAVPTFFINGTKITGDQSFEDLEKIIKPLL